MAAVNATIGGSAPRPRAARDGEAASAEVVRLTPRDPAAIVDELIEERAPGLSRSALGRLLIRGALRGHLHYDAAIEMAREVAPLRGIEALDRVARRMKVGLEVEGLENLPASGLAFLAANHPTGIADGVALCRAVGRKREDFSVFCNRDALRVAPKLDDILIPVAWRAEERTRECRRETLHAAHSAARAGRCVIAFPSGRLARMSMRGLVERPWQATLATLARKYDAPIVPVRIDSRNSLLFYLFALLSDELRDITLFRETLNKNQRPFRIRFGEPIASNALPADAGKATETLRDIVERRMARN